MTVSVIHDLLVILAAGLVAGLVCRWLRVSVLIGYLVVGAVLGRGVLGWVLDEEHQLEQFAEGGVFLLLFSIGLEFSIDDLKRMGRHLVVGGAMQMSLVAVPVAGILLWQEMAWQSAILIASAIAFSSTVLVFKALSEWGQSQRKHGRRAIGILLFQDAALVPLLLLVPLLTGGEEAAGPLEYAVLMLITAAFAAAVIGFRWFLAEWLIPALAGYRSPELVILFTLVLLGGVTLAAHSVGLPPAVGAFAAGLVFNGNRWTKQIDALVLPFRETFAAVFFIGLGLIFNPRLIMAEPILMTAMLVGVIGLKAIAATIALRLTGLPLMRSFGMGIGLAHVGEFAFVLVLLGVESAVIGEQDYQRVVAIAVGSLIATPVLIKLGLRLVRDDASINDDDSDARAFISGEARATVIGAGPIGRRIAAQLEATGKDVCLIDISPINLHPFAQEGFRTVTGDACNEAILRLADADHAAINVVCIPTDELALQIVKKLRRMNADGFILVRCRFQSNSGKLKKVGADHVVAEETEASKALLLALESASH